MHVIKDKIKQLPDIGKSFKMLDISLRLGALVPDNSITIAIAVGLEEGKIADTIAMVKSQAKDNRKMMLNILGEDLLNDIENF